MKVVLITNGIKSYYQKVGDGCFNFTYIKEFASELTEKEAIEVINHSVQFCKLYGATELRIEE
jgi:hypothetical protein